MVSKGLAKRSQHVNTTSCNIVAWCCDMCCTGWPNARNIFIIFNATCQCSCAPGPWCARSGPNAHALAQQCCVNVKRERGQTSTTSCNIQNVARKIWTFSNLIQHVATYRNKSRQGGQTYATCCAQQCCKMLRAFGQALISLAILNKRWRSNEPIGTRSKGSPCWRSFRQENVNKQITGALPRLPLAKKVAQNLKGNQCTVRNAKLKPTFHLKPLYSHALGENKHVPAAKANASLTL